MEDEMDVFEAIKGRRSIRSYKPTEVEEEKLRKVLEAARLAPSASNRQEWKFIVVKDARTRAKITAATYGQRWVGEAPIIIVACATEGKSVMTCGQPTHTVDLSIACSFLILQAYELGLGTCWLGTYDEQEIKRLLGIPDRLRIVTVTPLGYPNEDPPPRPRKSFEQIVSFEKHS
jgi:nitroreductase